MKIMLFSKTQRSMSKQKLDSNHGAITRARRQSMWSTAQRRADLPRKDSNFHNIGEAQIHTLQLILSCFLSLSLFLVLGLWDP